MQHLTRYGVVILGGFDVCQDRVTKHTYLNSLISRVLSTCTSNICIQVFLNESRFRIKKWIQQSLFSLADIADIANFTYIAVISQH